MSFPAYEEYKDSGIEWLGEMPRDWTVTSLKRVSSICYGIGEPPKYQTDGTRLVRATNVSRGSISDEGMVYVDPTHIPEQRIVWLDEGDIIVVRSGAYTGDSAIIPVGYGEAIAGFDMVMRLHGAHPKFVQYALLSTYVKNFQLELKRMRAAQPHLNAEELGECIFVAPCLHEQKAIASFLDAETSKIDALVSEQRRLIDLLKEKRQAVISHAVTKGLDSNAPMKDSGIQWLGEVPEHWSVTRLGYFATIENGSTPSRNNLDYWDDGTVPWVSSGEVNQYYITEPSELITDAALDECPIRLLPVGTILIGMIGQGKTRGLAAILKIEATINQNLAALITGEKLELVYLHYIFQSAYVFLREFGRGGQQAALNCEILGATQIPVPPVDEQKAIGNYLDDQLAKFDSLVAEAERAIELLQERRTALISAAVTGKIDVRGFAYQETA